MVKHCYIHIPFCKTICTYCDFCKQYYDPKKVEKYLEDLKQEIQKEYQKDIFQTIYIGGGTPTCLEEKELEKLLEIIDSFQKEEKIEITIEATFNSLTKEKLERLKKHHINRMSIGVESLDQKNQEFLGRKIEKEEIQKKMNLMRNLGFQNINLDLIYAIPNESKETLQEDLEFIVSLNPEHISTYSLMIEDHTILKVQGIEPIEEEMDQEMYNQVISYLKEKGYIHYEISNFAKPGYESKHNLCYWKNQEYYGFGCGAASYIHPVRKTNTRSLTNYEKGNVLEKEEVTEDDKIEYEILLGLRLLEGINLKEFEEKYHQSLSDIYSYEELVKQGFLKKEENHLKIPEDLLYVSNEIMVKLLQTRKVG